MPQTLQLLYPPPRLLVRVIPRPNSPHTSRLIPRITLRAIIKIRIRAPRAIHTDIPRHRDMRAPMRFAHYRHHRNLLIPVRHILTSLVLKGRTYATGSPNRPSLEFRKERFFVVVGDGADDVYEARDTAVGVFFADLCADDVEGDGFVRVVRFD